MKCKAFDVVIELEVQAVTCPGVWLCPNGKVTVQIYLLGLCTQTSTMNPVFPLLCHEKFTFRKNFPNVQNLYELDHKLNREIIYMELIQWEDCETGNVLATFKTSLMELLYPFPRRKGVLAGTDVDLLMEATRKFPGIISPKVEVSTKITIKEILCSIKNEKKNDVLVVNPKIISSKCVPKRNTQMRQKKLKQTKYKIIIVTKNVVPDHQLILQQGAPDETLQEKNLIVDARNKKISAKITYMKKYRNLEIASMQIRHVIVKKREYYVHYARSINVIFLILVAVVLHRITHFFVNVRNLTILREHLNPMIWNSNADAIHLWKKMDLVFKVKNQRLEQMKYMTD